MNILSANWSIGSVYFNYKGSHSIVLLAVCDAQYKFILFDIGGAGRQSDGGTLSNSQFVRALESEILSIPDNCPLPGTTHPSLPYVVVGDEAFPL
uniref:DDE Tnp4 domain-containing protein n=1 Tax=Amphimedon queenslandica TaxID=400682 RepID=A0A1X7U8F3_AMPQE